MYIYKPWIDLIGSSIVILCHILNSDLIATANMGCSVLFQKSNESKIKMAINLVGNGLISLRLHYTRSSPYYYSCSSSSSSSAPVQYYSVTNSVVAAASSSSSCSATDLTNKYCWNYWRVKTTNTRRTVLLGLQQAAAAAAAMPMGRNNSSSSSSSSLIAPVNSSSKSFIASVRIRSTTPTPSLHQILKNVEWPEQFPFKDDDFQRFDESPDSMFYEAPRFVTHIDDPAIAALTKYYSRVFPPSNTPGVSILDMCSSWVSHFPPGYKQKRVVGLGMNEQELKRNQVLTEYVVQDLNVNPTLPFEDNSFDVITNVVSVSYLTKPLDVFKEMCRILKPGGLAIISFSDHRFWTKAISIWRSTWDVDHVIIVGSYFHYAGGFEPPQAVDISPHPGRSDAMYIVYSRKLSTA